MRLALLLFSSLALVGCVPGVSKPAVPINTQGAFLERVPEADGGALRVGAGTLGATVTLTLEGYPLNLNTAVCAPVVAGARCDLGLVPPNGVYRLPYGGTLRSARAEYSRPDGSRFTLKWP
jgi:hypothetical protein